MKLNKKTVEKKDDLKNKSTISIRHLISIDVLLPESKRDFVVVIRCGGKIAIECDCLDYTNSSKDMEVIIETLKEAVRCSRNCAIEQDKIKVKVED
ncbi:hypothetical protein M0P65_05330 [Candidatus Gracilibacteria bacterium]|nr:hypothetical protein [Candidatus Gracilibacteria bacterium]